MSGLGSCLPRLGLSAPQLDAILQRADTDTAYEAFAALKATREMEDANPGIPLGETRRRAAARRKRTSSGADAGKGADPQDSGKVEDGSNKRSRQDSESLSQAMASYAYLFPDLDAFSLPAVRPNEAFDVSGFTPPAQLPYNSFTSAGYPPTPNSQPVYQAQPNFSGFGLTGANPTFSIPSMPSSSAVSSTSNGPVAVVPILTAPPPLPFIPQNIDAPPPSSIQRDVEGAERQRQLRLAVAHITNNESEGKMDGGPVVSREEIEHNQRLQSQLRTTMEETDGPDSKTDAMRVSAGVSDSADNYQLITHHLNKCVAFSYQTDVQLPGEPLVHLTPLIATHPDTTYHAARTRHPRHYLPFHPGSDDPSSR